MGGGEARWDKTNYYGSEITFLSFPKRWSTLVGIPHSHVGM